MKLKEILEEQIKRGDTVLHKYAKSGQHPLGGKYEVIALKVRDIDKKKTGEYAEVFLNGRFQTININQLKKTKSKLKDGEILSSKAHFSKDDVKFLKDK